MFSQNDAFWVDELQVSFSFLVQIKNYQNLHVLISIVKQPL